MYNRDILNKIFCKLKQKIFYNFQFYMFNIFNVLLFLNQLIWYTFTSIVNQV